MKNYFKADFHRIMTRRSRVLFMLLLTVYALGNLVIKAGTKDAVYMTAEVQNVLLFYGTVMVLINLFTVYGDDFRAGSMKTAIGLGLERWKIAGMKLFSFSMASAWDLVFLLTVQCLALLSVGKLTGGFVLFGVLLSYLETWAQMVMWMSLVSIILFWKQNVILGVLAYIYLMMDTTGFVIGLAVNNPIVAKFRLWKIGSGSQLTRFFNHLLIGQFDVIPFLGILLYTGAGIGIAIYLFQKKELDF